MPLPGIALKSLPWNNSKFSSSAFFTIASPKGCSDPFSAVAATWSKYFSSTSSEAKYLLPLVFLL